MASVPDPATPQLPTLDVDACRYQTFSRLVESLMHEVRNPLNALSINLEVLTERMRGQSGGTLPANHEKNLTAIRTQLQRVDATLRAFAEFLCPTVDSQNPTDFSASIVRAMDLLAHETRRGRVTFEHSVVPELSVRFKRSALVPFLALQPLLQSIARSSPGSVINVSWTRMDGEKAAFEVRDASGVVEPPGVVLEGMKRACTDEGLELLSEAGRFVLTLPLWKPEGRPS